MGLPAALAFTEGFNLSAGFFTLIDTTNPAEYAGAATVKGYFLITAPDGTPCWQGSVGNPDIQPLISTTNTTIPVPVDGNGDYQTGVYTFLYTIVVAGGAQPGTYTLSQTQSLCVDIPTPTLTSAVDYLCATLTVTDATSYGTWTIVSREIVVTNANNLASPQNTTGAGSSVTVSANIYPGTWSATLEVEITNGTCTTTLETRLEFIVQDFDSCSINCALKAAFTLANSYEVSGASFQADLQWEKFYKATGILDLINRSFDCGQNAQASTLISYVQTLLGATADCGCSGETPAPLVALCGAGSGTSYTFAAGSYLTVTNIAGTVTYALNATGTAILSGARNSVVTSTGGTITVTPVLDVTTTPPTWTYNVEVAAATLAAIPKEIAFEIAVSINGGGAPTLTVLNQSIYDSAIFQAPTLTNAGYVNVNSNAIVRVSNFLVTPGSTFKHSVQVTGFTLSSGWPGFGTMNANQLYEAGYQNRSMLEAIVLKKNTNAFDIQFAHEVKWAVGINNAFENPSWNKINQNFELIKLTVKIIL